MDDTAVDSEQQVASDDELDDMFSHPKEVASSEDARPPHRGRGWLAVVGLVVAGAAVGAIGVSQLNGHSSSATPAANVGPAATGTGTGQQPNGQGPAGNGQLPNGQGGQGGPGGLAGEQHISGTVTSVGSSNVTVTSSAGTATYVVTNASEIIRNGQGVSLSAVKPGDAVFVHVYPSNGKTVVERLFAGTSATQGQFGPGGPPPQQGQTGTTSNT